MNRTGDKLKYQIAVVGFGLVGGLVSSLAISGLILVVEKATSLPIGTFYLILMSAVTQLQDYSLNTIVSGFLLHLLAGSIIGLGMVVPFVAFKNKLIRSVYQYAPVYGLAFGFALWSLLFIPITFWMMLPLLGNLDNQNIIQRSPAGQITLIATRELTTMIDRILFGAVAFNMFYGLLAAIIIKSLSEDYLLKKESFKNLHYNTSNYK